MSGEFFCSVGEFFNSSCNKTWNIFFFFYKASDLGPALSQNENEILVFHIYIYIYIY
jgi:hypothetical protein